MIPTGIEEKLNQLLESQQELLQLQKQNSEQLKTIADLNAKIALQAQTIAEQAETIAYAHLQSKVTTYCQLSDEGGQGDL